MMNIKPLPVWSLSLGCPKNRVDTEKFLGSLGIPIKPVPTPGKSKLIFINTCAFIEPACRESIRAILDIIDYTSKLKRKPLIVVAGCLPGRYGAEELVKELPEVDVWLDPSTITDWPLKIIHALNLCHAPCDNRLLSTAPSYAWLKISDGCRQRCSFCTIPSIRGPLHSVLSANILAEASLLIEQGVKELILVGQDVTAWGYDMNYAEGNLATLLQKLALLPNLDWLRLLYLYPDSIDEVILRTIAELGKPLLPYLDIPFQHADIALLKKMGRSTLHDPYRLIEKILKFIPDAALRTTLIVGFPGETEEQFAKLLDFVKNVQFYNLGVFTYHAEEGTPAAQMPNQIPENIKEERRAEIMNIQAQISSQILSRYVDSRMQVLVDHSLEEEWPGLHQGRVWFQAPEVDGITYVSGSQVLPGNLLECEIVESTTYDLTGLA